MLTTSTRRRFRIGVIGLGAVLLGSALVLGCSDDDDNGSGGTTPTVVGSVEASGSATPADSTTATVTAGADAEVEDFVRTFIDDYNSGNADAFFGAMTDEAATEFLAMMGLDTTDLEAAKQEAAAFIGEDPIQIQELTVTDSSENAATVELIGETASVLEGDLVVLTREGGEWKVSSLQLFAVSPEPGSDYTVIDVGLDEFAFNMTGDVSSGKVAFALDNTGEQPHEAFLVRLDEGVVLEDALQEEEPAGVEFVGGVFNVEPGASYNLIFTNDLTAGRYAFVCFLPDLTEGPDGTPHAFKGMVQEFNIE